VQPPLYEKKIGRPPKSRKKQPHETQGKNGPKFFKHGVTIHCSHCTDANHNIAGCKLKRMGFTAAATKDLVANTRAQAQAEAEQAAQHAAANTATEVELEHPNDISEPINQSMHFQDMQDGPQIQASTTLLSQMLSQVCVCC